MVMVQRPKKDKRIIRGKRMKTQKEIAYDCYNWIDEEKAMNWLASFRNSKEKWFSEEEYNLLKSELAWCYAKLGKENSTKFMQKLFGNE